MKRSAPTIRAVLFDADGVLQSNTNGWIDRVRRLSGQNERADEFLAELFAAERPCMIGKADFAQELASVLNAWNSKTEASEALKLWRQIEPNEAAFVHIRSIRQRGTRVALATNQQRYRAEYMLNQLAYAEQFDHILLSCDLGYAKPSIEYFRESVTRIGIDADQILFIDDGEANVESARLAGLNAEQFHLSEGIGALERVLDSYRLT